MNIIDIQTVKKISYGISLCFLLIHMAMLVIFFLFHVIPMVVVNCLSIFFYIASMQLVSKEYFKKYIISIFLEVQIHMGLAVFFVGWDSGFQITLIGMNIIIFYGEYLTRTLKYPHPSGFLLSLLGMTVYLTSFVINYFCPPKYSLPEEVSFWLQIMWGITVFVISIMCLRFFVNLTVKSEMILSDQASTDKLTGVFNRAEYDRTLTKSDLTKTVMLLIDGDNFKHINDSYGHEAGDRVLKKTAYELSQNFLPDNFVFRFGGDEFVVLVNIDNTEEDPREHIIRKINKINRELSRADKNRPTFSISVGAAFGKDEPDKKTLFEHADQALYKVKQNGGCGCAFYGDE